MAKAQTQKQPKDIRLLTVSKASKKITKVDKKATKPTVEHKFDRSKIIPSDFFSCH